MLESRDLISAGLLGIFLENLEFLSAGFLEKQELYSTEFVAILLESPELVSAENFAILQGNRELVSACNMSVPGQPISGRAADISRLTIRITVVIVPSPEAF